MIVCPECEFKHNPEVVDVLEGTRYGTVIRYRCCNCGNVWPVTVPVVVI